MYSREELGDSFGPYEVNICDEVLELKDKTKLSVRFWFPGPKRPFQDAKWKKYCEKTQNENEIEDKFPTILEYLAYCKSTWTAERDHLRHPWLCSHGYVVMRPDMRGSGDSEGLYFDEYLQQEQDDANEVIAWIAEQLWSNGNVGMFGKSWGGFNGLQVAFTQPPALKAVITLYSTDNRYTDEVHWKGGSLIASQMLSWSAIMFAWNARPPHPSTFVGEDWKKAWKERLEVAGKAWTKMWTEHQIYDDYWKHGSICEDYNRIKIPVLAIGGWHDMYSNAVFRMVENLPKCRGIIGPWSHDWPDVSTPGPNIGFMPECLDFWDHHLKGKMSARQEKAPKLIWYQCSGSVPPMPSIKTWPGNWCSRNVAKPDTTFKYFLNEGQLLDQQDFCGLEKEWPLQYDSTSGWTCGEMLSFGAPDLPGEQAFFNNPTTTWKSQRLQRELDLFGFPQFTCQFQLHNDTQGSLIVKLCDEFPDGQTRLISFGVMNLCHFESHETPQQLRTGKWYDLVVQLDGLGYKMLHGHKIVVNICCSYWPMIWTPRRCTNMMIRSGHLSLPILQDIGQFITEDALIPEPKYGPALKVEQLQNHSYTREFIFGLSDMKKQQKIVDVDGRRRHVDSDIELGEVTETIYELNGHQDPLSAKALINHDLGLTFEASSENPVKSRILTKSEMTSDLDNFHVKEELKVFLNDEIFFEKCWNTSIPRIFV